jgi:hypothetical protein
VYIYIYTHTIYYIGTYEAITVHVYIFIYIFLICYSIYIHTQTDIIYYIGTFKRRLQDISSELLGLQSLVQVFKPS